MVTSEAPSGAAEPAVLPAGHADFQAVYTAHFATLVRLAYVTTANLPAAEDIAQDAYVDLYRRWSAVVEPVAWLRRAVASRSTSWVRRRMLERRHKHERDVVTKPMGPDAVAVRDALARLRPKQRAAVFLRYYLDLPEAEVAAALRCRPGTVKSLLHRALATMKEHLDG